MSCVYEEDLTAYLDGELAPSRRAEVEAHLPGCADCQHLVALLNHALSVVRTLPEYTPAKNTRAAVLRRVEPGPTWAQVLARALNPGVLMPSLGLAGALALALVVNVAARRSGSEHLDARQLELASNLDMVEDLDVLGLDRFEDLDVVEHLQELEVNP